MTFSFLKTAKYFLTLSGVAFIASIVLIFIPGPRISIEFTGGTLLELRLSEGVTKENVQTALEGISITPPLGNTFLSQTTEGTVLLRTRDLTNEEHLALIAHLKKSTGDLTELQYTTIGPTVGASLKRRSIFALFIASVAIVLYIALAFRKIPRKLSPWKFGILAVVALIHDITIVCGIFVILSHMTTFEVDTLFVSALLTILGYSVNDTIVIFDRMRSNLQEGNRGEDFAITAERSLHETLTRTLNTGTATIIMLFALFFLGSESIRWFVLALIIGTIIGTYSSIYIATPLLVYWRKS